MRFVVFVLTVVLTTALTLGAGVLVALEFGAAPQGLLIAASFGIPFLVVGPVLVGSLAGVWDRRSSPSGRQRAVPSSRVR